MREEGRGRVCIYKLFGNPGGYYTGAGSKSSSDDSRVSWPLQFFSYTSGNKSKFCIIHTSDSSWS